MKNWNRPMERLTAMVLAMLMLFSCISLADSAQVAERTPADYVFTDYGHSYHLVSFLNGYNVLAFGNAHSKLHMMGAILVQGVYSGDASNSGFADGEDLPPSFVKGEILAPNSVYNSRNHSNVAPLYVGSANTVATWTENGLTKYSVNGVRTGNDSTTPVYVNDDFFNFNEAYEVIKTDQATMQARGTVVKPVNGVVTVNVGDNVIIESLDGVNEINIIGDPTEDVNTTISVLDSGNVHMPREHFNGSQPAVREQNEAGTAVVFNFSNAKTIALPTQNWVGHVIAPDADVTQDSGNFNGTIICKNIFTGAEGHIYNYNTEKTSWDTVFSLEKVWNDGHDADGIRPTSIKVQLLANGKEYGDPVELKEADGWYYVWPALPELDSNGDKIVYSVRELNVPEGYTSEYVAESQTLINTHDYEEIDVRGTKTWTGESSFGSRMRPMYLTVYLYADGVEIDSQTITVTDAATQSYVFEDLPKYKNGVEIKYTVQEETVPGYIGTTDGWNLTNTWGIDSVEVSGKKTWKDDDDRDGLRPTSVTIELLADGVVIEEHVATATHGWTWSFTNLPETDQNGKTITYTVREKDVPKGYTSTVSGYDIINEHEVETVDLSGKKTWNDDNNNDGLRPESIVVILLADGAEVARKTVTAADGWAWAFNDMPKNFGGKEIYYHVHEVAVEGYTTERSGMNLTNTHENETVDVEGEKTWNDNDNNDGLRPDAITINLMQDGKKYASKTVTEKDGWAWAFNDLPKYTDGKEHVYTIEEEAITGYTAKVDGYDVTNTHEEETIDVLGHKVWNDNNNNNDGKRPARLTVYLLADGERTGKYRTTTADRNWYWIFEDLPKYENGREIVYSFEEEAVDGYTGPVTKQMTTLPEGYGDIGYELTNTHEDEQVEISGAKTWEDNNNQDGKRPTEITIRLWKTVGSKHEEVAARTVTASDNWTWDFGKLPKYEGGQLIVYTITEDVVEGYSTEISGYDVKNSYTPGKVNISGVKHWNDADDQDGLRPTSITVNLLADGVKIDSKTVTEADNWAWSFTDLDEYKDQKRIVYTIAEDVVEGYDSVVDQYDLINTHVPETVDIAGVKTWNDNDNQDGLRPERITIRLHKTVDGKTTEIKNAAVTAANNWKWHFVDLPKYEDGKEIMYTITEDAVAGYDTEISGTNAINTHETEETSVSGKKTWNDANNQDGKRPASITINLLADGVEIDSKTVTEKENWAWSFTDLPKFKDGKEIKYTITEDAVEGYTTEVNGYNVINSYEVEKISVEGYKVWQDDSNRDGKRPEQIVVRLLADGVEVDSCIVTAANGWMGAFTDLPKYKAGKEIKYTITEDPVPGYTATVEDYIITNTYKIETVDISGSKTWNDNNDQDGKRPTSITIRLWNGSKEVARRTVTAANNWAWNFNDLPKYANGKAIVYSITEDAVTDYSTVVNGFNVTNSYTTEETSVSGSKTWNDNNNQDGKRPASITINLLADGVEVDEKTVTEADGWKWTFDKLPKYANGKAILYTITEDPVVEYTSMVVGYNVVNTRGLEETTISGTKFWVGDEDALARRPSSVTINLLANGVKVDSMVVTADDNWAWSFTGLPMNQNGQKIDYTISEEPVARYTTLVDGYDVYNTYECTNFAVTKRWRGVSGSAIEMELYANGVLVVPQPQTVRYGEVYVWEDLPRFDASGEEIVYYALEKPMEDYSPIYVNEGVHAAENRAVYPGGTIINVEMTSVAVRKVWADVEDGEEVPQIQLVLYCNGVATDVPMPVPTVGGWYIYENLPAEVDGVRAHYTVHENPVDGFMTTYVTDEGVEVTEASDGDTIINKKVPTTGDAFSPMLWLGMFLASAALLMVMFRRRRA